MWKKTEMETEKGDRGMGNRKSRNWKEKRNKMGQNVKRLIQRREKKEEKEEQWEKGRRKDWGRETRKKYDTN